jgi:hypothetical protein
MTDLAGKRFGYLVVVRKTGRQQQRKGVWLCQCDCGNEKIIRGDSLKSEATRSCGCLHNAQSKVNGKNGGGRLIHGHTKNKNRSPEYNSWHSMLQRCTNPKDPKYHLYGGRGIRVCPQWNKFENFLSDMGPRPQGKSLDRYPNLNGDYHPTNCRWATPKQQAKNSRRWSSLMRGPQNGT